MDFVDFPGYGMANMGFYLGSDDSWDVQNFGLNGETSYGLFRYLASFGDDKTNLDCLNNDGHIIADNVAFHIGGNDYRDGWVYVLALPWEIPNYVNRALNNIERSMTRFYKRKKNVLLIGNYPTIAYSPSMGEPKQYIWGYSGGGFIHPTQFDASVDQNMTRKNILDKLAEDAKSLLSDISQVLNPKPVTLTYPYWVDINTKTPTTLISLAALLQESLHEEIVNRRRPYFQSQGKTLEYLNLWNAFVDGRVTQEPWVANHVMFSDLVHPNYLGFALWGKIVSDKIHSLGWDSVPVYTPPMTYATSPCASAYSFANQNLSNIISLMNISGGYYIFNNQCIYHFMCNAYNGYTAQLTAPQIVQFPDGIPRMCDPVNQTYIVAPPPPDDGGANTGRDQGNLNNGGGGDGADTNTLILFCLFGFCHH